MIVTADFETFFSDDFRLRRGSSDKVGLYTAAYVCDPRFTVWGCAVKVAEGMTHWLSHPQMVLLVEKMKRIQAAGEKVTVIGQNLVFDGLILAVVYGFIPDLYICTMGMGRAVVGRRTEGHGLDALATYYGHEGKVGGGAALEAVRGVLHPTPQQMHELGVYAIGDVDKTYAIFRDMAPHFPADEYIILDHTIRAFCEPELEIDAYELEQALTQLRAERAEIAPSLGYEVKDFTSNKLFPAMLRAEGVEPPTKPSPAWGKKSEDEKAALRVKYDKLCAEGKTPDLPPDRTFAFSKKDRPFAELGMRTGNSRIGRIVEARFKLKSTTEVTRQEAYRTVVKATQLHYGRTVWPVHMNFSGAKNTHRLSGGDGGGGNPQNLGKKSPIRKSIKAKKGKLLVVADLSGIELRTCAALANDQKTLQQVRDNDAGLSPDPYCLFSTDLYGEEIRKPNYETDTPDRIKFYSDGRTVGKISKLSLQYQVGADTAVNTLWTWGVEVTPEFGANMVKFYRSSHREIKTLWDTCQNLLLPAIATGQRIRLPSCPLIETFDGGVGIPGMLPIRYTDLRQENVWDENWQKYKLSWRCMAQEKNMPHARADLYGGKVTENLSQYTAWKVMGFHWRLIHKELGLRPLLNVHDELVYQVDENKAEEMAAAVLEIMRISPPWWPDLPVNAEVGVAERYGDAK